MQNRVLASLRNLDRAGEVARCRNDVEKWFSISLAYLGLRELKYRYWLRVMGSRRLCCKKLAMFGRSGVPWVTGRNSAELRSVLITVATQSAPCRLGRERKLRQFPRKPWRRSWKNNPSLHLDLTEDGYRRQRVRGLVLNSNSSLAKYSRDCPRTQS